MHVASLSPAITEILFQLGLQGQIVCRDENSDYPEEVKQIAAMRDSDNIDPRNLYEHEVELVFTMSDQSIEGDFSVSRHNPQSINDVYEMIRNIGMMMQVEKEAAALVLHMQQGFKDVKRKSTLLPHRGKVYIEGCSEPWVKEVAHIAGLELTLDEASADITVADHGRVIDKAFLKRPGPRLIEGARYLYGWAFENLH